MTTKTTVPKEQYLHEAQFAIVECQYVEEGLKSYICTAYETIRLSGGDTNSIEHNDAEIEKLPLGKLIPLFERLNSNTTLVRRLHELVPQRNHCAHKAFVLVFLADTSPSIDLNAEFERVKEAGTFACATLQMLIPELRANEAKRNAARP